MTKLDIQTEAPASGGDLEIEIGRAQAELKALEQEKRDLPQRLREAAERADASALVSLRQRFDSIDAYIFTANVKVRRLRIVALESEAAELDAELPALRAAQLAARTDLDKAKAAMETARSEVARTEAHRSDVRGMLNVLNHQIAELLNDAANAAPIVRSPWQVRG
jgi:chromosome segregation ATPase